VLLKEDKTVKRLAKKFTTKVPKLEFSLAEILLFLLKHKQSPREAIDNVEVQITRIMEDRKKAKNNEKRFVSLCCFEILRCLIVECVCLIVGSPPCGLRPYVGESKCVVSTTNNTNCNRNNIDI
jgi:hypothetical protein